MAWSESKIFVSTIEDILENTTAIDLNSSTFNVALFDNSITPSQTVVSAETAYNAAAGVWDSGEVYDGAEWAQGGQALDSVTFAPTSNVLKFDADNEVSAGTSATLVNVYGVLIYNTDINTPVDSQGLCYLYAGGVNSVTDGTLTVIFHTNGIMTFTL
ncbi:MAG: hypothetical protein ACM3MJ_00285 [Deltaproteobacteria bacterium]